MDRVKGGDAEELSPLLALGGGGSSFSHIVLISALWPRCGCVKAAGVPRLSPSGLALTPRVIQGCVCVLRLTRASSSFTSQPSPLLPSGRRPPFSAAGRLWCLGSSGLPAPSVSVPPSPAPSHCCRPQLCMCFTAAVKDKKQSLPPPLLFSARMSLPFL